MRSRSDDELIAAADAYAVAKAVLDVACEDVRNGFRSDLKPLLAARLRWTSVLTELECRAFVGAIVMRDRTLDNVSGATALIDEIGWWKATALGRGAPMSPNKVLC